MQATLHTTRHYQTAKYHVTVRVTKTARDVDFADILAACEVVPDECMSEAPWEACDGWEHRFYSNTDWRDGHNGEPAPEDAAGYTYSDYHERSGVIVPDAAIGQGVYNYYREKGLAKQVCQELAAREVRRTTEQLVQWHRHGWQWFGVTCDYLGAHASLWGIDDEDYAQRDVTVDIAHEVAAELVKKGYRVHGVPACRAHTAVDRYKAGKAAMWRALADE